MNAYCCECKKEVEAEVVGGEIIYPHRPDLYDKEFCVCPYCRNYTGVYQGESIVIPTKHIRVCRHTAHRALDKIWHSRKQKNKYYAYMGKKFKRTFHWGEIKNEEEADRALTMTLEYLKEIK